MRHPGDDSFANRRKAADEAKQKLLEKLKNTKRQDGEKAADKQPAKPAQKA